MVLKSSHTEGRVPREKRRGIRSFASSIQPKISAAELTAKGRIAAATYRTKLRTQTACRLFPKYFTMIRDMSPLYNSPFSWGGGILAPHIIHRSLGPPKSLPVPQTAKKRLVAFTVKSVPLKARQHVHRNVSNTAFYFQEKIRLQTCVRNLKKKRTLKHKKNERDKMATFSSEYQHKVTCSVFLHFTIFHVCGHASTWQ